MATFKDIEVFAKHLDENYELFKEKSLKKRRIKHKDITPLIEKTGQNHLFEKTKLGESTEGRSIFLLKAGSGEIKVLLWSQMHGNEPTATQALFDIFNFLNAGKELKNDIEQILSNISLYFVPMLNPDGAEAFKRRNALDIDLNRDATRLAANESRILKTLHDEIKPDFGFNLHDQNPYYTVSNTEKPATMTFLAPAYNHEKDINDERKHSMQAIVLMNRVLQKFIPGQVGRYYFDGYGPTSMGDNMQKSGTRTILIESGEYTGDIERQEVRKLNFIAILSALKGISEQVCQNLDFEEYNKMPETNDAKLFHLLIKNAIVIKNGKQFTIDIGINYNEKDNADCSNFSIVSEIVDLGDLTYYFGYQEIDANGMTVKRTYASDKEASRQFLNIGDQADFDLTKDGQVEISIKNGQIINK
ncbi:MAG: M14 family zinc carboxypeptidase [Bacteroidota bacterium]